MFCCEVKIFCNKIPTLIRFRQPPIFEVHIRQFFVDDNPATKSTSHHEIYMSTEKTCLCFCSQLYFFGKVPSMGMKSIDKTVTCNYPIVPPRPIVQWVV